MIGGLHPAVEGARQDDEAQTDETPREVRHLEHGERQEAVQESESLVDPRCGPGNQQHGAGKKHQGARDLRNDRRNVSRGELMGARDPGARRAQFLRPEQYRSEQNGDEVVDRTIGQQRAEERFRRDVRQRQDHYGLEHTDAAGHVADDSGDHRRRVSPKKGDEVDVGVIGQQPVDHRTGQTQVNHGERDLRKAD